MPTIETTAAWLLSVMVSTIPPGRSKPANAAETADEGKARYGAIAQAIAEVVHDESEAPLFRMNGGRQQTAALLLAVAFYESSWRRDVDLGIGASAFGDTGRSCGLWQAHIGKGTTLEGYSCTDLVADRKKAARSALASMRRSANACRRRPMNEWLNVYASGSCERGAKESRARVGKALEWFSMRPREPREAEPSSGAATIAARDQG
jgi:hypothetical protein